MRFDLQLFAQERTEPATPRKRRKEREEGRVARSQDLGAAVVILTGLFSLLVFGRFMYSYMRSLMVDVIAFMGGETIRADGWFRVLSRETVAASILPWLPLGLVTALGALIVTTAQVGIELTPSPLFPRWTGSTRSRAEEVLSSGRWWSRSRPEGVAVRGRDLLCQEGHAGAGGRDPPPLEDGGPALLAPAGLSFRLFSCCSCWLCSTTDTRSGSSRGRSG